MFGRRRPQFLGVAAALVLFAVGITGSAGAQGLDNVQVTVSIDKAAAGANYVDPQSVGRRSWSTSRSKSLFAVWSRPT